MENYSGQERRRFKRVKLGVSLIYRKDAPMDVNVRSSNIDSRAKMLDLGEGGLAILTDVNIPVATVLWVKFTLSKAENKSVSYYGNMELLGEVRYSVPEEGNTYRVGISFVNIKDKLKVDITNFLISVEDNSDK